MLPRVFCTALILLITIVLASESALPAAADDKPRDLDTHHLFTPPSDRASWETRRADLRRQVLFSAGLWPMPKKTPLHPMITGKVDADGYTIENVALETRPGFFLCGNLYRPKGRKGSFPGIVNPHGHWTHGRLEMQPDVSKADPDGAMGDGRGNLVAIGVNLARQGFVVFAYDAVGYNDTNQVNHEFAKSLRAWANGVSELGLQLWDSIRVVDYLQSLKDVDRNRIGCTGASGGGSQTFLLTAVDDRVKVSVPVNMVSAHMQGGCLCENGPGLRVGTDNVEIAAIMAPRPMLMVAATGDWTKNNPTEEWPAVKKIYDLYGAGDKTAVKQFNYQHNYNIESREAMYAWFGKWLLNDPDPVHFREKPFTADVAKMHVWTDKVPMPKSALAEPALTAAMIDDARRQLDALWPSDSSSLKRFRAAYGPALEYALSTGYPAASRARSGGSKGRALVVVYADSDRERASQIANQLRGRYANTSLLALPAVSVAEADLWKNYYSTYNRTPFGDRVDAVVKQVADLSAGGATTVDLVGIGYGGPCALFASALTADRRTLGRVVVDLGGLDLAKDDAFLGPLYAPGIRRAGDIATAAMLTAPAALCIYDSGAGLPAEKLKRGYDEVGCVLRIDSGAMSAEEIGAWLTAK